MKYVLFEGAEKLHGYVIFEKDKEKNLYYFDLGQNKVFEVPFAKLRVAKGRRSRYNFYRDGEKNIMINYVEKNNKPCLQFIELKFSDRLNHELLFSKEVEGIFINEIIGRFRYFHQGNELFYSGYDGEKLINLDTFKVKELFTENALTPLPVDFFDNKYLALGMFGIFFYDEDKIETVEEDHDNPFIEAVFPSYSMVLRKVLYRSDVKSKETIAIFDAASLQIIDTGITPMEIDRFDRDIERIHFFGEHYILYGRYKEKASRIARKLHKMNFVLPALLNPPVEYIIYDYINRKEIGYVKNCQLNQVYDFFPEHLSITQQ